jgi:hypothetical protein
MCVREMFGLNTCRWSSSSVPLDPNRPTARGMGTGPFFGCPGVAGVCWDTFSVTVLAEALYSGVTLTWGVPAWPYLSKCVSS